MTSNLTLIQDVKALKVFNSRGEETIEVMVKTFGGLGVALAPAGKSRGKFEVEYYPSGGVEESVEKIESIVKPRLLGEDAADQERIDRLLHVEKPVYPFLVSRVLAQKPRL
ncbi:MAG: hypothetical protein DRO46_04805, partial [Candidatus Hecatellales archaeon]